MWIDLPSHWIWLLNLVGIPVIHLGISWVFTRVERENFPPDSFLFRSRTWEEGGAIYQTLFRIRSWKDWLPDAATWFNGFAKRKLGDRDPEYLHAFIGETCRSEAAHVVQFLAIHITLIWNPWPTSAVILILYSILSNLPCFLVQRFTRLRLRRLLAGVERRTKNTSPSTVSANTCSTTCDTPRTEHRNHTP
jgi:glycosyl-4,4'-diaponeurosporenoate acyltransferase